MGQELPEMWEIVSSLTLMSVNTFIYKGPWGGHDGGRWTSEVIPDGRDTKEECREKFENQPMIFILEL